MPRARVDLTLDQAAVQGTVGALARNCALKGAHVAAERAKVNLAAKGRIDTGALQRSIRVDPADVGGPLRPTFRVGTDLSYAVYQEEGTRPHGPVRARFLVFKPKGSSTFVFARWVRGVTPAHYMRDALTSMRPADFVP